MVLQILPGLGASRFLRFCMPIHGEYAMKPKQTPETRSENCLIRTVFLIATRAMAFNSCHESPHRPPTDAANRKTGSLRSATRYGTTVIESDRPSSRSDADYAARGSRGARAEEVRLN